MTIKDFTASWCGPCQTIAPFFKQLSTQYPNAVFLKVDVDKCPGTAAANQVSSMPSFLFFRNSTVLDKIRGANKPELENKVKKYYEQDSTSAPTEEAATNTAYGGHVYFISNLNSFFQRLFKAF